MVGLVPDEGEILRGNLLWRQAEPDRGTDLDLLLFTGPAGAIAETIVAGDLTEPAVGGYARITLTDANWTHAGGGVFVQPAQTFTPAGADWSGANAIRGYAVLSTGTTPRILAIELDPNEPITVLDGNDYEVTPQMTMI